MSLGEQIDWEPARPPGREPLGGEHVLLRPVEPADAAELFQAGRDPEIWTYLPYGPYDSVAAMRDWLEELAPSADPLFYAICPLPGERPRGIASYLRITPEHGHDRDRSHLVRHDAAEDDGGDRSDLPARPPCLRRARLPPSRVEVQRPEREVPPRR